MVYKKNILKLQSNYGIPSSIQYHEKKIVIRVYSMIGHFWYIFNICSNQNFYIRDI